jgi:hypothetical protein
LPIKNHSQTNFKPEYSSLFDSVKIFYGDTCFIGVNSNLIKRLYGFKKYVPVKTYLNSYESIRKTIENFRKTYIKAIYDEKSLLLDLSRIFKEDKQQNIVNACGIYLGPDSVTNIALSYVIIRSSPFQLNTKLYQMATLDQAFKYEITNYGDDWYNSRKLKELMILH